jgi:hypothetical protein
VPPPEVEAPIYLNEIADVFVVVDVVQEAN